MLFNSFEFLLFFPVVFLLYWFVFQKHLKAQNAFILVTSYVFYGWWDWRFLGLIAFSSLVDYWTGLKLGQEEETFKRKVYLGISLGVNLGLLGFFKYFNFFIDSTIQAINALGFQANEYSLQLILPVGISFYTFQTMSYTIDIYRKQIQPTKDPVAFFAYVSFFPQLVAGPIERASNLLPQFFKHRVFNYTKAMDGMRQILWGFFMKMVIADNCAVFVDQAFKNPESQPGINLLIGAVFFSFQIYGDFGGYSNIAIGTGKLLGFDLMRNFAYPNFSRDIAEFWRRWHISLSTWFRDYVYIPLGGSRVSRGLAIRNIFIIFLVSGFWHGANWTFIVWGGLNAIYFLPLYLSKKNRINTDLVAENTMLPSLKEFTQILITFLLTTLTWVFFRSPDVSFAIDYLFGLFSIDLFSMPQMNMRVYLFAGIVLFFVIMEWMGRKHDFAIQKMAFAKPAIYRYGLYYSLVMIVFLFARRSQEFIYFQF
ncbi:MBOAT family O-acyltransferase [Shivajiella indica]|uniref:MBOAT family O-acyltransferase n=1 Tax=Shivajiella indica TaxID=872115 RepID=A0ABW5BAM4_9BACT